MLKEKAEKYYSPECDLNCAEATLYAINDAYDLQLTKDALKMMAGFGGGMAIEETCGAVTGAIAALSIMFVEDRAHEGDRIKSIVKKLFHRVEEKLGTANCKLLKEKYRHNDEEKCKYIVLAVAEVVEEIIQDEAQKNK
ncbi:C_GCAxxG_C_C family probable redox protein [Natronincola peptidivorans]|uniref:C_GCAxxG_C_C family probable redox protein n=1 Tax=Natronincola peptidivorans TaxID=426128 RepID=A0A1I0FN81_9FIRM|nr:C-GCAxxG-C-C family (seleno)protein [Natronincola peptidivorans]SET59550.1 C_GCAxxG_C_C family probable redox protein [Natronincola peptidivorans]